MGRRGRPVDRWWAILTLALAAGLVGIGATTTVDAVRWPCLAGGLLGLTAPPLASRSRPLALAVLVPAAVIPAALTWWSVVTPVTGALLLICGGLALRPGSRAALVRPSGTSSVHASDS